MEARVKAVGRATQVSDLGVLVGLHVEVLDSTNPSLRGLSGKVVDETMKTLRVEAEPGSRVRQVPKGGCRFRFRLPDGRAADVEGRDLVGRPEDRVYIRAKG